jgi:hypothetical protein
LVIREFTNSWSFSERRSKQKVRKVGSWSTAEKTSLSKMKECAKRIERYLPMYLPLSFQLAGNEVFDDSTSIAPSTVLEYLIKSLILVIS